jgi:hypothetical protein
MLEKASTSWKARAITIPDLRPGGLWSPTPGSTGEGLQAATPKSAFACHSPPYGASRTRSPRILRQTR